MMFKKISFAFVFCFFSQTAILDASALSENEIRNATKYWQYFKDLLSPWPLKYVSILVKCVTRPA